MPRVAVIGGGLSALAVAYRLKQRGVEVRLLDRAESVGGVIRSERRDGYLLEWGPNSFRNTDELIELVDDLGLDSEMLTADPKAQRFIFHQGELQPVPGGLGSFITSSLLSASAKLRLLKEPFIAPRREKPEESVAEFVNRRLGREIERVFVGPFISGVYAGDSRELSVSAAFPKLAELESDGGSLFRGALKAMKRAKAERQRTGKPRRRMSLISFRDGVAALPRALARDLRGSIETGCRNIAVQRNSPHADRRFTVTYQTETSSFEKTADAVVIGVPAFAASELVRPLSPGAAQALDSIPYPPVVVVCAACGEDQISRPLDGFGFLVPRSEGLQMLGCIWSSSLFDGRAPKGRRLLTIFLGGATDPSVAGLDDGEIAKIVSAELRTTLKLEGSPQILQIVRHKRAIPQYTLGHLDRVRQIESAEEEVPGLFFAGNYLHGVSGGDCVTQSNRAAGRIARLLLKSPEE